MRKTLLLILAFVIPFVASAQNNLSSQKNGNPTPAIVNDITLDNSANAFSVIGGRIYWS